MKLKEYAKEKNVPIIMDQGLQLLLDTIKDNNCKSILELGTAIGYSAINIAKVNKDIVIDTIEKKEELYIQAQDNVLNEGLTSRINLYNCNINDFVTNKIYDFIFVDAAKGHYNDYLEQFYDNLCQNGILFFDNMEFHGFVKNPMLSNNRNTRQLVKKIIKFYDRIILDTRFESKYYSDVGDGILILRKR